MGCRQGNTGGYGNNAFNAYWTGSTMDLYIDNVKISSTAPPSDYRIKKDVIDLDGMWETVKALRPIKYTQAEFSPPAYLAHIEQQKAHHANIKTDAKISDAPLFYADNIERWGFLAHELQETLTPTASTGEKDSADTIQTPNPFTVIAALTKALQEAMARIEALEAVV
jgi:hypothetical protein